MFKKTQQLINNLVESRTVPGISYCILTKMGMKRTINGLKQFFPIEIPLDATKTNRYDLASLTKVIGTTTRILQLVEAGKLSLHQPAQFFLPHFQFADITILDLLTHRSGLAKNIPEFKMTSRADVKNYVYKTPQTTLRNTFVEYADVNFILLGNIIEVCDNCSYEESIRKHILAPLNMKETNFFKVEVPCEAVPTELDKERGLIQGVVHDFKAFTMQGNAGHAGLFSTLHDLTLLAECLLFNKGEPLFSEKTAALLSVNYTENLNHSRGLGYDLRKNGDHFALYHTGFTGPFLVLDQFKQQGLIVLTNRIHPTRQNDRFLKERENIVFQFLQETNEME